MACLHIAVLFGNEGLTRTLLEEGSDPNVYDERLGTPLSIAILKGYRSIVQLLSENGADHNNERFTSALVHSRLDEFNLPHTIDLSTVDNRDRTQKPGLRDRSETRIRNHRPVADDSETNSVLALDEETVRICGTGPNILLGSRSEIRRLFKNNSKWEDIPDDGEAAALVHNAGDSVEGAYAAYAIVEYMERSDEGGWSMSKFDIHGSKLCGFLSRVLKNYPGAGIGHSRATIHPDMSGRLSPNFIGLFHRMERYIKLSEEEIDPKTMEQAKILLQTLKVLWIPIQYVVKESRATGLMEWTCLWTIYQPGEIAILNLEDENNEVSAARIVEIELTEGRWNNPPRYQLTLEVVDWNGSYTGYTQLTYGIPKYDGFRKLTDIGIHPLSYNPDREKLKERLVQRGRTFESLRGCFFMARKHFNATQRVIVDNYAYYRFHDGRVPVYKRLGDRSSANEYNLYSEGYADAAIRGLSPSSHRTGMVRSIHSERSEDLSPLTDNECLLCISTMKGFDVQGQKWIDVHVDSLKSISWNDDAFNQLAMQEDRKRLILAFARQKQVEETGFDDFISGKGKSFIILLCGPPGVGKTLTAESVAERTRAPLYTLSACDLGTDAESVERSLKKALEMCALWKAVMLIDEADVFLEARKTDSLERNEIVSAFLRLLEYYKGILFLTTNRVAAIDAAFESRIDLIVPFDALDQAARREVWSNFTKRLGGRHELCDADIDELSRQRLNGREIKSSVKTALMLANNEKKKLQMEHLRVVLRVRQRAAGYITE
ncbi:putative AAA family protein [Rosellinia necatrix]|uniref:Putative AAA family protein n=1 Tax=Rosellinia necatrix TaxID=77044 RepID=A0A1W2TGM3_ROSNE|nr:putative AAA family protein [Rosellinia necatrix]